MKQIALIIVLALAANLTPAWSQGGPNKESTETVAKPRRAPPKDGEIAQPEVEQPKIPSKFSKKEGGTIEGPSFRTDVNTVNLDVAVVDNKGNFIPNIPRGNFRVLEDGVPQNVTTFGTGEGAMTICMVIEFSNLYQRYWTETWYQTLTASYGFLETLKPEDYVAVVAYDLRPEILSDFSTDKQKAYEAMRRLRIPAFSEANLFDTLVDTAERMTDIEGRKAILVLSTGIDTFSKLTFDKTRKALQNAGVPIYGIGLMQTYRELMDAYGMMGPIARLDFLQADNQMRTFSKETGGMSFFPRFYGEFPNIFRSISDSLRNQYNMTYSPSNQTKDGKYRKIKVELVNPATGDALRVVDAKGKPIKYTIVAKQGYTAPREVE